jgi:hypothetical protein
LRRSSLGERRHVTPSPRSGGRPRVLPGHHRQDLCGLRVRSVSLRIEFGRLWVRQPLAPDAAPGILRPGHRGGCRRGCGLGLADRGLRLVLLGLERLQRAQGAPELGLGGAAVAEQRREGASAVAIADEARPRSERSPKRSCSRSRPRCDRSEGAAKRPRRCAGRGGSGGRPRARARRGMPPRASYSAASSSGRTTWRCAQSPCFSAFCAERALPASVFGPRDFAPLRRLASALALGAEGRLGTAAPRLCMAGLLAVMERERERERENRRRRSAAAGPKRASLTWYRNIVHRGGPASSS